MIYKKFFLVIDDYDLELFISILLKETLMLCKMYYTL